MKSHSKQNKHSAPHNSLIPAFFFNDGQDEHCSDGQTKSKGAASLKHRDNKDSQKAKDKKKVASVIQRKTGSPACGKVEMKDASKGKYCQTFPRDSLIPAFFFDEGQEDYNMNATSSLKHSSNPSKVLEKVKSSNDGKTKLKVGAVLKQRVGKYSSNARDEMNAECEKVEMKEDVLKRNHQHDSMIPAFFFNEGQDEKDSSKGKNKKKAGSMIHMKTGTPTCEKVEKEKASKGQYRHSVHHESMIPSFFFGEGQDEKDSSKAEDKTKVGSMIPGRTETPPCGKVQKEKASKRQYSNSVHHDSMIPAFFFKEVHDEHSNSAPVTLKHHSNPFKISNDGEPFTDGKTKSKGNATLKWRVGKSSSEAKDEKKAESMIHRNTGPPHGVHHDSLIPDFLFDESQDYHNMNAASSLKHSSNSSKVSKKEKSPSDGKTELKGAAALRQRDEKNSNKAKDIKLANLMFQRKRESSTCGDVEIKGGVLSEGAGNNSRKLKKYAVKIKAFGKEKLSNAENVKGATPMGGIRKNASHTQENKNEIIQKIKSTNHRMLEFQGAAFKRSDAENSKKAKGERMKSMNLLIHKSSNHGQMKLKGMSTLKGSGVKDPRKETYNIRTAKTSNQGNPSNTRGAEVKERVWKRSASEYSRNEDDEKNVNLKVSRKGKCLNNERLKLKELSSNQSSLRSRTEKDTQIVNAKFSGEGKTFGHGKVDSEKVDSEEVASRKLRDGTGKAEVTKKERSPTHRTLELKGKAPKQSGGQGLSKSTHGNAKTEVSWGGGLSNNEKVALKGTTSKQRATKELRKANKEIATTRIVGKVEVKDHRQEPKKAICKAKKLLKEETNEVTTWSSWQVTRSFQDEEEDEHKDEEEEEAENEYEQDDYEDEYLTGHSWKDERLMQVRKDTEYDDEEEEGYDDDDDDEGGGKWEEERVNDEDEGRTWASQNVGRFIHNEGQREKENDEYKEEDEYEDEEVDENEEEDEEEGEYEDEDHYGDEYLTGQSQNVEGFVQKKRDEEYYDDEEEENNADEEDEDDDEDDNDMVEEDEEEAEFDDNDEEQEGEWEEEEDEGITWASGNVGQSIHNDEEEEDKEEFEYENEDGEDNIDDEYEDEDNAEYSEKNDEYGDDDDDDVDVNADEEYADEERREFEKYDDGMVYEENEEDREEYEDEVEVDEEEEYGDEEKNEEYGEEDETEEYEDEENEEYGDEDDEENEEYDDKEENKEYGDEVDEEGVYGDEVDEEENEECDDEEENEECDDEEENEECDDEEENEECDDEEENEECDDEEENEECDDEEENEEYNDEEENEEYNDEEENDEYGDDEENKEYKDDEENNEYGEEEGEEDEDEDEDKNEYEYEY